MFAVLRFLVHNFHLGTCCWYLCCYRKKKGIKIYFPIFKN